MASKYKPTKSIHFHTNPCKNRATYLSTTEKEEDVTCKTCLRMMNPAPSKKKYNKSANDPVRLNDEFNRRIKESAIERACLRCSNKFMSTGNRICYNCKTFKEWGVDLEGHALLF